MKFANTRLGIQIAFWLMPFFCSALALADTAVKLPNLELHQARLANGLRVIIAPDHSAPVYAIDVTYNVGSATSGPAAPVSPTCSST